MQQIVSTPKMPAAKTRTHCCSGCGKQDHRVNDCNWIGVVLHGFINVPIEKKAMDMVSNMTHGGLVELARRLDVPNVYHDRGFSRYLIMDMLKKRWYEIRFSLYEMLEKEYNELKVKIAEAERMRALGYVL